MANLVSEKQVKEALQIDSFRNLSKEKVMEFASLIPNMDKDVAISIINQFPEYTKSSKDILEKFNQMCDSVLNSNKESQKETILAYKLILEELSSALNNENISSEERIKITDKMIEVADKISAKDTENKQFLDNMIKYGGSLAAGALILGAVILGVNVNGVELPKLKK